MIRKVMDSLRTSHGGRSWRGLVVGLLLAVGRAASAGEPVVLSASPTSLQSVSEQVRALFRSASISFAVPFDRPPIFVATDTAGVTLLLGGEEPGRILRLSSTGEEAWHHDVPRTYHGPFPPEFTPGENGSVMCAYMVIHEEGPSRYLVLGADGSVAMDDTLQAWTRLSPDGQYCFSVYQEGNEVVLRRLSGQKRRVRIPPMDDPEAAKMEQLTIGFAGNDRIMVTGISAGKRRSGLLDLSASGALWTELQFPPSARPACIDGFQVGFGRRGEFIYVDYPDSSYVESKVFAFDADGNLIWDRTLGGEWIWTPPQWVVCSVDQELAALITHWGLGIIETRTGRLLDAHGIDANLEWVFEGAFVNHRLAFVGQGGTSGNAPFLIQAAVGSDGKIVSLKERPILMRGLAAPALSCIVTRADSADSWIVTGFRK
jgi:hypothetical protein